MSTSSLASQRPAVSPMADKDPASSGAQSPSATNPSPLSPAPTSKSSYAGDFWNIFFNSKSALAEAFRRDPKLRDAVPAYVLGRMKADTKEVVTQWVNYNVKHIHYFSYRNRLPTPLSNGLDHDAGWGCMIRTGQMMLCEALRRCLPEAPARQAQHLFHDLPTAPFGLHSMTEAGAKAHIPVGQWFSPTCLAVSLRRLVSECPVTSPHLAVVVGMDGCVKRQEISNAFLEGKPALVLVPIMAGRDKIPAEAERAILKTFQLPCTLGIVGGRPKHSLYFVGAQASNVFFLDPHTVQPAFVSPETVGNANGVRGTMTAADMDPSMLLCFYLPQQRDVVEWERAFAEIINPLTEYPLFSIIGPKKVPGDTSAPNLNQPSMKASSSSAVAGADADDDDVDDCAFDDDSMEEGDGVASTEMKERMPTSESISTPTAKPTANGNREIHAV